MDLIYKFVCDRDNRIVYYLFKIFEICYHDIICFFSETKQTKL